MCTECRIGNASAALSEGLTYIWKIEITEVGLSLTRWIKDKLLDVYDLVIIRRLTFEASEVINLGVGINFGLGVSVRPEWLKMGSGSAPDLGVCWTDFF